MINTFSRVLPSPVRGRRLIQVLFFLAFGVLVSGGTAADAQRLRVDVGGGWAFPIDNVELDPTEVYQATITDHEGNQRSQGISIPQPVDLTSGRHLYLGVGLVWSISDNFALGGRLRAHTSEMQSTVDCRFDATCESPSGTLRAATLEGRIILTSPDWIEPYLLVGLGVVQTSVDGVTLRDVGSEVIGGGQVTPSDDEISFSDVSIVDAGGDVGLGAAFPLTEGLSADVEFRVAGSLPGGKENAVTVLPLTLGVSYRFQ